MADSIQVMTAAATGRDVERVLSSAHFSRNSAGDSFLFAIPIFLSSLFNVLSNVFEAWSHIFKAESKSLRDALTAPLSWQSLAVASAKISRHNALGEFTDSPDVNALTS